jgi:SAM-dependent methyltransferase
MIFDKSQPLQSPVTRNLCAKLVETIPVLKIIENYQALLKIDVSKYFEGLTEIGIYQCMDTGFRFYYPGNIFADESFYAFLQKKDFYYSDWYWEHQIALENLVPASKILEVGCGTGSFMERLKKKEFDCTGLELNQAAVDVCKKKGLSVYKELLDTHSVQHAGGYDAVCAFQVLEHVYDVHSFINESLLCLKPGGKFIVAVPNNTPYYYQYDKYNTLNLPPHHSGLWNKSSFLSLPAFFPLQVHSIKIEPLFNRDAFMAVYMDHLKMGGLYKRIRKIGPGIISRLLWPLKFFVDGKCIMAVFTKK